MSSHPLASTLLQEARLEDQSYNSDATREAMTQGLQKVLDGKSPYPWQLDAAEAILLGLDCIVFAGKGAGKTIPFVLPLLVGASSNKMVIVISPLNAKAFNQAERFKRMGINAIAANGMSYSREMHLEIESRKYNIIITSPEMCLGHIHFSSLLQNPKFMKYVMAIVIDEAHSVSKWGENFRESFSELGWLRSHVPGNMNIPFYAMSAALPQHILGDVIRRLHFSPSRTFFLNLGNDCLNITHFVFPMRSKRDLEALDFIVDEALSGKPLTRTIVFFETRLLAYKGATHLRALLPDSLRPRVDFLTPGRSENSIKIVMGQFRSGSVDILCVTEAASMDLDIQDVRRVVGYMVPRSLSIWMQQSGFAGRSGSPGIAILFVEPSVFQLKKSKKQNSNGWQSDITTREDRIDIVEQEDDENISDCDSDDSDSGDRDSDNSDPDEKQNSNGRRNDTTTGEDQIDVVEQEDNESLSDSDLDDSDSGDSDSDDSDSDDDQGWDTLKGPVLYDVDSRYRKRVEGGLRRWIGPKGHTCRRCISREYFNSNPLSQPTLTVPYCDRCILREIEILALRETIPSPKHPGQHSTQGSSGQVEDPTDVDAELPRRGD